jgi:hypothetical protein
MRQKRTDAARPGRLGGRGLGLLAAAALVACLAATVATASVRTASAVSATQNFCSVAKGFKSSIDASTAVSPSALTKVTSIASLEATIKAEFTKLPTEETAALAVAPSQIKGDLQQVFAVDNKFIGLLQKVNVNFLELAPYEKQFEADAASLKAPIAAISAYFKTTCGYSIG